MDHSLSASPDLQPFLLLELRGRRFNVDREHLMILPESILLCLFPNGLVFNRQPVQSYGDDGQLLPSNASDHVEEEDVYFVDFDPTSFDHILTYFQQARTAFYGAPLTNDGVHPYLLRYSLTEPLAASNPLCQKQAVILLREELEFFPIPPNNSGCGANVGGTPNQAFVDLKAKTGLALLDQMQIFSALQRNVNKENSMGEEHLIEMLCMSGFEKKDQWSYRAVEPGRCVVTSVALVMLKSGIKYPAVKATELQRRLEKERLSSVTPANLASNGAKSKPTSGTNTPKRQSRSLGLTTASDTAVFTPPDHELDQLSIDHNQMQTAQKLLLFWRKPAVSDYLIDHQAIIDMQQRKCWWDADEIELSLPRITKDGTPASGIEEPITMETMKVTVWSRRVWTLELALL